MVACLLWLSSSSTLRSSVLTPCVPSLPLAGLLLLIFATLAACCLIIDRCALDSRSQAIAALNGLALTTEAVLACGDIVVAGGGLPVLLGIVKSSSRSKEAADALRAALLCLSNICRSRWACPA